MYYCTRRYLLSIENIETYRKTSRLNAKHNNDNNIALKPKIY